MPTTEKSLAELVAEVSATLQRIEKRGTAPAAMGSFPFVRIVDVMDALKPELDARGIILRPLTKLLDQTLRNRGETGYTSLVTVELELWAVRKGEELLLARTIGSGTDTQDKAPGKAASSALKQAILQAFAIPTGEDIEAQHVGETRARSQSSQQRRSDAPASDRGSGGSKAQQVAKINALLKQVDSLESQTLNRYSIRAHIRRELQLDSVGEVLSKGNDEQRAHVVAYIQSKLDEHNANGEPASDRMDDDAAIAAGLALLEGGAEG